MIEDISSTLFNLYNLGIIFLPIEMIKGNNTTGLIAADYNRITKV